MSTLSDLHDAYMADANAQQLRYESAGVSAGGGISDTRTDEYAAYFGQGEWSGAGVERRVQWSDYLREYGARAAAERPARDAWLDSIAQLPAEPDELDALQPWDLDGPTPIAAVAVEPARLPVPTVTAGQAFRMSGAELRTLCAAGDTVAAAEIRPAGREARRTAVNVWARMPAPFHRWAARFTVTLAEWIIGRRERTTP